MTDKEFVLSIYPDTEIDPDYIVDYFASRFEKDGMLLLWFADSEAEARRIIDKRMLRKL
jgi:hypothetical protein